MDNLENELNSVEAVMQVFMLIVYADGVRHNKEITEILDRIEKFKLFTDKGFFPNVSGMRALLEKSDHEMMRRLEIADVSQISESVLRKITNSELIAQLLPAMRLIADSDAEFHSAERQVINDAIRIWESRI